MQLKSVLVLKKNAVRLVYRAECSEISVAFREECSEVSDGCREE